MSAILTGISPRLTDERLFSLATWAPLLIAIALLLLLCFCERGRPTATDGAIDTELAPPTAPDLASLEGLRRAADRG